MKIKCLIIDDEPLAISVIESHLESFDSVEIVATFTNPIKAYETIEQEKIDLIFLDINMPQVNGLDFLDNLIHRPLIVITTAYREFAVKSYELDVLDYLVKPIPFDRFIKTINKVYQKISIQNMVAQSAMTQEPYIFLKANKKLVKINLNTIVYVESLKDYVRVSTTEEDFIVHKSLTALTEELPDAVFIRIHRSFTISINKVVAIDGNLLELTTKKIPIGRNYVKQTKERILNSSKED